MITSRLRHRLLLVLGLGGAGFAGCGESGSSETDQTATDPAGGAAGQAGSAGLGGSDAGGAGTGGTGLSGAGQSGAGVSGIGGAGQGGAGFGGAGQGGAGAGGSAGAGAVPCPPAESGPVLTCYPGSSVGPSPGCSANPGASENTIACYVPGATGAPASPCLDATDPALPKLLTPGCAVVQMIEGPPRCQLALDAGISGPGGAPASPHCCYTAQILGVCQARPFVIAGLPRRAALATRQDWLAPA